MPDPASGAVHQLRGDPILESLASAAERLLLAEDWRAAAGEMLAGLGRAAGVDHAVLVEAVPETGGSDVMAEWAAPQAARLGSAAAILGRAGSARGLGPEIEAVADTTAMSEPDRTDFGGLGVGAFASVPIVIDRGLWGWLGFAEHAPRIWTEPELDGLRAGAGLVGAVITSRLAETERAKAQNDYRRFVEHIPAVTYTDVVDPATRRAHMGFVSPQIEDLLGHDRERFLEDPRFWFSLVHPDDLPRVEAAAAADAPFDEEYRMRAADGRDVWVHDTSTPVIEDGRLLYWQGFAVDVTDRREAEQRLRQAEERARAIIEQTPAITYQEPHTESGDYDPDSAWLYVSPQVELILGYTRQEWTSEGFWLEVIHPDDRDAVMQESRRTINDREPYRQDYRVLTKDGRLLWFHDEAVLVEDEPGKPAFWQGVMMDITERKLAEEQLRRAEERHRALIEHIPAIVYTESPDADPARFYISPQVRHLTGATPEEWTWTPGYWKNHIHPDDRAAAVAANEHSNRTKEGYVLDYRFRHTDGHWLWIHDEATFVVEPNGEGFWQGFMFDVTEAKRAEEQLREAEEKFRTIVEQSQAVFYVREPDPTDARRSFTTYIGPGNRDLIGYTVEEIRGDPGLWNRIIHPDDRRRVEAATSTAEAGADQTSLEYRLIAKDGRIVWVQDEARLIHGRDRAPYWQGFLLDITERKNAEGQLAHALQVEREAAGRLRALDDMKNTFLQAVSHDLRTPLAAILGLAITLERKDVQLEEHDARDLAHRIAENARRLDRLVVNLLDMDRLARGIVAPKLQRTDLAELVQRVVEESDLLARSRIRLDLRPVTVPVDAAKVERIVENLLANAARHAPPDATVWVSVESTGDGVLVRIEDDGPGIAPELRDAIFEPFRQGPGVPKHTPGVGVGLALVRRFAELHGGRAWVADRVGGGASFRVWLPSEPNPPVAGAPPRPPGEDDPEAGS